MKKINLKPIGKLLKGLVREGLQTLPIVGPIVTSFKTEAKDSPKGEVKLSKWDIYRLVLGFGIAYLITKGILTEEQIAFVWSLIGY